MSVGQAFTSDLRSEAKDFNRDKNSRAKWANGQSFGPGRRSSDGKPRPAKISSWNPDKLGYTAPMKTRTALNRDMINAGDDSSADEEIGHPSIAPDAEIAYSFDAARGPSHGSQILCHALDKAIERFETKETDKLIKNEYEVLDMDLETPSVRPARKVAPEDEEYDFVDA